MRDLGPFSSMMITYIIDLRVRACGVRKERAVERVERKGDGWV